MPNETMVWHLSHLFPTAVVEDNNNNNNNSSKLQETCSELTEKVHFLFHLSADNTLIHTHTHTLTQNTPVSECITNTFAQEHTPSHS